MLRRPTVAGQFYSDNPVALQKQVNSFLEVKESKKRVLGVISPHAGYIYSGRVAGAVFSSVAIPDDIIILGPNHHGMGATFAIMKNGSWEMPNGTVPVNADLASFIIKHCPHVQDDYRAHVYEHSLEVQVPFLQALNRNVSIVPIAMSHAGWNILENTGVSLGKAIKEYGKDVLIVASSDMTHYESDKAARAKDKMAIERILALDPQGLLETVQKHDISMCGVIPATVMLVAAKTLGAKQAHLVKYATSGEVSGDYLQVVGYAGIYIE